MYMTEYRLAANIIEPESDLSEYKTCQSFYADDGRYTVLRKFAIDALYV